MTTFQNILKTQILTPLSLTSGTGYVGPSTQKILNEFLILNASDGTRVEESINRQVQNIIEELSHTSPDTLKEVVAENNMLVVQYSSGNNETTGEPSNSSLGEDLSALQFSFSVSDSDELMVFYPSLYMGHPGDTITLLGSGFDKSGNTVHFGENYTISGVTASQNSKLTFTVPDLPPGRFILAVSNTKGRAEASAFRILNKNIISSPNIKNISPLSGDEGTAIVITGSGFESTGNTIYTTFAIIENIPSSDGKTITFALPNIDDGMSEEDILNIGGEESSLVESDPFPVYIYVENNNGLSNDIIFLRESF